MHITLEQVDLSGTDTVDSLVKQVRSQRAPRHIACIIACAKQQFLLCSFLISLQQQIMELVAVVANSSVCENTVYVGEDVTQL